MSTYKTTGIILRRVNYGEADRIITFLTPEGKVSAIAKGVRRITSKLAPHLELFTVTELMLARGKNLDIVTSARIKDSAEALTADYERLRRAFLLCEISDKLLVEAAEQPGYELLAEMLNALKTQQPELVELYFKLRLLDILGYRPNLEQCVQSHQEIVAGKRYFFNPELGGVVAEAYAESRLPEISDNHIKLWRLVFKYPLEELAKIKNVIKSVQQSLPIANDFYDYLFGKRFRSSEI